MADAGDESMYRGFFDDFASGKPLHPDVEAKFKDQFPNVRLLTVEDTFGGWEKVQKEHFASGALLDQLYGQR